MDRDWTRLCLLVLTVPLLAGCLGDEGSLDTVSAVQVDAASLEDGQAYQFHHTGGDLHFETLDGEAVFVLFDPQDNRLGELELGAAYFRESLLLDDMVGGEYVIFTKDINGTFQVRSEGQQVAEFLALGGHFERAVIAEAPMRSDPSMGVLSQMGVSGGEPIEVTTEITLSRTPTFMQLVAGGQANDMQVHVQGGSGTVLTFDGYGYSRTGVMGSSLAIYPLGGEFEPRNVRGAQYTAQVTAEDFSGVLILESWSYSRYVDPVASPASTSTEEIAFTYGELPVRPAAFEVHKAAEALYFWTQRDNTTIEDCDDCDQPPEAWVSLYDPSDDKVGTYRITPNHTLRVAIEGGGEYVAVAKGGTVFAGSDRVPVDFELRVLDTIETYGPPEAAGNTSKYEVTQKTMEIEGVAYGLRPEFILDDGDDDVIYMPGLYLDCSAEGSIRIIQDGETLGFWGESTPQQIDRADLFLQPGPVRFVQDGAGGSCGHWGMQVFSYIR